MDWIDWYINTSLYGPYVDSRSLDGRAAPTEVDLELIELIYLVTANEQKCSECGHLLGRGLRIRNASAASPSRWPVWVDTKCWGWRRHPHVAQVTRPDKDLMLGELKRRLRCT